MHAENTTATTLWIYSQIIVSWYTDALLWGGGDT